MSLSWWKRVSGKIYQFGNTENIKTCKKILIFAERIQKIFLKLRPLFKDIKTMNKTGMLTVYETVKADSEIEFREYVDE